MQQAISTFLTMFSILYGTYFFILNALFFLFEMSSAICFKLDESKILLSGNGLMQIVEIRHTNFHLFSKKVTSKSRKIEVLN